MARHYTQAQGQKRRFGKQAMPCYSCVPHASPHQRDVTRQSDRENAQQDPCGRYASARITIHHR
eukprot:5649061-Pleurochrysis_carterae.AAC.1